MAEWAFLTAIFHFPKRNQDECSAPLEIAERLSHRHWLGCNWCLLRLFPTKMYYNVPPIKITDLVPPLTKVQWTFISAIPICFQIANKKTRRCTKTLKGSHRMGGGQNLLRISAPLSVMNSFLMKPLLAWSITLGSALYFYSKNQHDTPQYICITQTENRVAIYSFLLHI